MWRILSRIPVFWALWAISQVIKRSQLSFSYIALKLTGVNYLMPTSPTRLQAVSHLHLPQHLAQQMDLVTFIEQIKKYRVSKIGHWLECWVNHNFGVIYSTYHSKKENDIKWIISSLKYYTKRMLLIFFQDDVILSNI